MTAAFSWWPSEDWEELGPRVGQAIGRGPRTARLLIGNSAFRSVRRPRRCPEEPAKTAPDRGFTRGGLPGRRAPPRRLDFTVQRADRRWGDTAESFELKPCAGALDGSNRCSAARGKRRVKGLPARRNPYRSLLKRYGDRLSSHGWVVDWRTQLNSCHSSGGIWDMR